MPGCLHTGQPKPGAAGGSKAEKRPPATCPGGQLPERGPAGQAILIKRPPAQKQRRPVALGPDGKGEAVGTGQQNPAGEVQQRRPQALGGKRHRQRFSGQRERDGSRGQRADLPQLLRQFHARRGKCGGADGGVQPGQSLQRAGGPKQPIPCPLAPGGELFGGGLPQSCGGFALLHCDIPPLAGRGRPNGCARLD